MQKAQKKANYAKGSIFSKLKLLYGELIIRFHWNNVFLQIALSFLLLLKKIEAGINTRLSYPHPRYSLALKHL